MSTKSPRLESSIKEYLSPVLREDGFSGSGRTFRRVINGLIQIVNVQGSRWGGQFAINLGVQPSMATDVSGQVPNPKKIDEPSCVLRRRLSESGVDQWWTHDGSKPSMDSAVAEAAQVYVRYGRPLLAKLAGSDSPLNTMTVEDVGERDLLGFHFGEAPLALALGQYRLAQGKKAEAKAFAEYGMEQAAGMTGVKRRLKQLLESCGG